MEIYILTISFPYDEDNIPWVKIIEVKEDFRLFELHEYIQNLVEFDNDHLFEFYVDKTPRNLKNAVSEGMRLNEIYPITGCKLYYLFDFGDSWIFQIKKSRKKRNENKNTIYPVLLESTGINPEQYTDYEE
ncbi:MAG: plasmid pRiA4b ORF-3 family protein [Methylococcales symbiont of Hymedesmia sp. n. MRB-2018]|nr:MAG: plasmid pRiA4b ORF-3 family protein [Methylococcales symbiont of Hymedesmia sp. n. MRB-2018]KAF3984748.1 MAG: plasmid pRiA4b ORF-3 family protein [Methylococcales symbiont of Hymedesmia sp. n. MRB-2018]